LSPSNAVVTILDDEVNFPPVVAITSPASPTAYLLNTNSMLVLEAAVSDDGRPIPPGALTIAWSKTGGPGTVTFGSSSASNTTARFSTNGTYLLTLSAFDGFATSTDAVTVVIGPDNAPSSGLQAHWKFNETNGTTAFDSSTNARDATVSGAQFAPGRFDHALNFDGVDDIASFNSPALTQFTVSAWIRSDSTGDSFLPRILSMPGYSIRIRRDPSATTNALALESIRSTTSGEWRTPGPLLFDGVWYHVAVGYDSSSTANTPIFYLNGALQPTTLRVTPAGAQAANTGLGYIGNSAGTNNSWDGLIDEVRLYSRILSTSEVQLLAAGPTTNFAPVVEAGPAQTVTTGTPISMNGSVTNDGKPNPPGLAMLSWSQFSGPGSVEFADEHSATTTVTVSSGGTYVLRLTADDGRVKTADDVTITVNDPVVVGIRAAISIAFEFPGLPGLIIVSRTGDPSSPLSIPLAFSGTASNGIDYVAVTNIMTLAANAASGSFSITPLPDGLPEGDETATVTVLPGLAYLVSTTNRATVTIRDRPWEAWRLAHFTTAELTNAAISGAEADPDSDRLSNLLEYSVNLDPRMAETNRAFTAEIEMNPNDNKPYLVLTHKRRTGKPSDVRCEVFVSNDLATWSSGPIYMEILQVTDDGNGVTETVRTRVKTPIDQAPQKFVRLGVTLQ
jgi:hypothetical protein